MRRRWIPILGPFVIAIGFYSWARLERDRQMMAGMQSFADGGDSVTIDLTVPDPDRAAADGPWMARSPAPATPSVMPDGIRGMRDLPVPSHPIGHKGGKMSRNRGI